MSVTYRGVNHLRAVDDLLVGVGGAGHVVAGGVDGVDDGAGADDAVGVAVVVAAAVGAVVVGTLLFPMSWIRDTFQS